MAAAFAIDDKVYLFAAILTDYSYLGIPAVVTKVIEGDTGILYLMSLKLTPIEADNQLLYIDDEDDITVRS